MSSKVTINVERRSVYGNTLFYPVNEAAKTLALLMGKKTFSRLELWSASELVNVVEISNVETFTKETA